MTKSAINCLPDNKWHIDWLSAPAGFDWCAQDADGRWFWYSTEPILGADGGVWRSNSRNQQFAAAGAANPDWLHTLQRRPQT